MSRRVRVAVIAAAIAMVFVSVVFILLQILPAPHRSQDYFVVGAVATMVSMVILFVVLITSWMKTPDVFFKRRKAKEPTES